MFAINSEKHELPAENRGRGAQYPFAAMEVGDSFDAPRDMGPDKWGKDKRQSSVSSASAGFGKRQNPKRVFSTRLIDENTVRCWRVK